MEITCLYLTLSYVALLKDIMPLGQFMTKLVTAQSI